MKVAEHIKGYSTFVRGDEHALWYRTDTGVVFPVPLDDIDGATFGATEKSMMLMRWIRKCLAEPIAKFAFFRAGNYWYVTEDGFEFPVPADDISAVTATTIESEFLFYITKHKEVAADALEARETA